MINIIFAVLLIAHGLVHSILAAAPIPNDPYSIAGVIFMTTTRSWLLPRMEVNDTAVQ